MYATAPTNAAIGRIPRAATSPTNASAAPANRTVYQTRCATSGPPPNRCTTLIRAAQGRSCGSCVGSPRLDPDQVQGSKIRSTHAVPIGGVISPVPILVPGLNHLWIASAIPTPVDTTTASHCKALPADGEDGPLHLMRPCTTVWTNPRI